MEALRATPYYLHIVTLLGQGGGTLQGQDVPKMLPLPALVISGQRSRQIHAACPTCASGQMPQSSPSGGFLLMRRGLQNFRAVRRTGRVVESVSLLGRNPQGKAGVPNLGVPGVLSF